MAIIYSYPVKSAAANEDLILISDSADSNKTKQLKVSSLPGGSTAGVSSITIASGTSTGNALVASSPTGGVTLTTNAFAGAANVGHVPSSAAAGQTSTFLRADGSWSAPSGANFTAGTGIDATQLASDVIQADLLANGGLIINGQEMQVDLSATSMVGTLSVARGGTGFVSAATHGVILGNGTSALNVVANPSSVGYVLTSTGSSSAPTWQAQAGGGATNLNGLTDVTISGTSAYFINIPSGLSGTPVGNLIIGNSSGNALTTGYSNILLGYRSGAALTEGYENVAIGQEALFSNNTGDDNTTIGFKSLYSNESGLYNTTLGSKSGLNATNGSSNTLIGYQAGAASVGKTLNNIVAIGANAGFSLDGLTNTNSNYTVTVGSDALQFNQVGTANTVVGGQAGQYVTGGANVIIGAGSGQGASGTATYSNNTMAGYRSGRELTSGGNNTFLGYTAGKLITSGVDNVCIGYQATTTGAEDNNAVAIGSGATAATDGIAIGKGASAATAEIELNGITNSIVNTGTGTSVTKQLKITINGTVYYIDLKT